MPTDPLLQISGLSAHIGGQTVLHDVSLSLGAGGWMGIVGGSGAGKTTLLRTIMGLRRPACPRCGEMIFDARPHDFCKHGQGQPRGIAYVPQSPAHGLDPLRRIGWQWAQALRYRAKAGQASAQDRQIFDALGLPQPEDRHVHEWSLGMQQRLLVAMAMIGTPRLLILDEPTSALDSLIAAQVLSAVETLARTHNIAVLMVTHDLALAARYCEALAIMKEGRVVETGPAEAVLRAPTEAYTRELVAHRTWHVPSASTAEVAYA